ncbi:MAG: endonuclease/exonuclease/phosphatase family protein [Caldilineaceae bacterium]
MHRNVNFGLWANILFKLQIAQILQILAQRTGSSYFNPFIWRWLCGLCLFCLILLAAPGGAVSAPAPQDDLPGVVRIFEIQGTGRATSFAKQRLNTMGLVTAVTATGFYVQDPTGDDNPQSSDGIFVYTRTRPDVRIGDCLLLQDVYVQEFYEKTELSELSKRSLQPGRFCLSRHVQPEPIALAQLALDPALIYERVEGMVVALPAFTGIVQGPTKRFEGDEAEISLIDERLFPYIDGQRIFHWQAENVTALMFMSSSLGAQFPNVRWGDRVRVEPVRGEQILAIVDYNFGKYQLLPLETPRFIYAGSVVEADKLTDRPAAPAAADEFTVCTFNGLGLGRGTAQYVERAEYEAQLHKRALAIATQLSGCTIIGMQEIGTPAVAEDLVNLLANEFQQAYRAVSIPGPMTANLEFPLTNTFLVRSERAQIVDAEQRQACSPTDYEVPAAPGICPDGQFALFNRPPLVLDVAVYGDWDEAYLLTVITNHWKSKGGDESVNSVRRMAQARHVAGLVQARLQVDPNAHIVVLGDLNDYYASEPVAILQRETQPALLHTYDFLPDLERYTYIFNGASQVLDHILISPAMLPHVAQVDPVHINADYPYPQQTDANSVHHSSDHDPVVLRLRPGGASWVSGEVRFAGVGVQLWDVAGALLAETTSDAAGQYRLWNLPVGRYTIRLTLPAHLQLAGNGADSLLEQSVELVPGLNTIYAPRLQHNAVQIGQTAAHLTGSLGQ